MAAKMKRIFLKYWAFIAFLIVVSILISRQLKTAIEEHEKLKYPKNQFGNYVS